ncbi:hypothetical protein BHE74_00043278 [Ensete ventricosum]|uniref:Uncharacterized protein n=1 Tax=Ensete ventricosum TaxID=4639 RepID=A0A426ZHV9_ENSVE|nr:hypothetical protein B296_00042627 [Ensete ventricosum]RWW50453.1 hypothetical protein BHE74_00043278 [Ensete ventricosum]
MNLSPSNLDANLTSTPFLDPDPAPPTLDDPSPGGNSKESRIGGTGNRGGGGESSGRGDREEGGEDPDLLQLRTVSFVHYRCTENLSMSSFFSPPP